MLMTSRSLSLALALVASRPKARARAKNIYNQQRIFINVGINK